MKARKYWKTTVNCCRKHGVYMPVKADENLIERHLRELSRFSSESGRLTRQTFSDAWAEAVTYVECLMKELDMTVKMDGFGNLTGIYNPAGSSAKPVGTGSHLDTVINGGAYDGATGLIAGIEAVRILKESGIVPERPVEVIAFAEEEGGVFGKGCLGSEYMAGSTSLLRLEQYRDSSGRTPGEAAAAVRYDKPVYGEDFGWAKNRYHAFFEMHAEQGIILFEKGKAFAIVDGVVGIMRTRIAFTGQANHAGTTEMSRRQDAVAALSEFICTAYSYGLVNNGKIVVTNGKIGVLPNQHNVIPGEAWSVMEMRSDSEEEIRKAMDVLRKEAGRIAEKYGNTVSIGEHAYVPPISFDRDLIGAADRLAAGRDDMMHLFSWAGHDAKIISKTNPAMMIFIPSKDGYSHCPEEYSDSSQIAKAVDFLVLNMLEADKCI